MFFKKIIALPLIVLMLSLGACAPKGPTTDFRGQYYPECFDPITRLCQDQDNTQKVRSAGMGALFGALAGALVGVATTRKAGGALAGAAAGAVAGGVAGYAYQHIQQIRNQERRLDAYRAQFGREAENLDLQKASTLSAYKCYQEQMRKLKEGIQSGRIKKGEAMARAAEIRAGLEELKKFWEERTDQFDANQNEVEQILVAEAKRVRTYTARDKHVQMSKQVASNRSSNSRFRAESQAQDQKTAAYLNEIDTYINVQMSDV